MLVCTGISLNHGEPSTFVGLAYIYLAFIMPVPSDPLRTAVCRQEVVACTCELPIDHETAVLALVDLVTQREADLPSATVRARP